MGVTETGLHGGVAAATQPLEGVWLRPSAQVPTMVDCAGKPPSVSSKLPTREQGILDARVREDIPWRALTSG